MSRHRPLWQRTRWEITAQSVRDFLVTVAWGVATAFVLLWRWV